MSVLRTLLALSAILWLSDWASITAGEVRLKNGIVLHGRPSKIITLSNAPQGAQGPTTVYSIVSVNTGWRRYYVPMRQVPDDGLSLDANLGRLEEFEVPQERTGRLLTVQAVGAFAEATPFDHFGRRRVNLATPNGVVRVVQGITRINPEFVTITGLTHSWELGIGLGQLGPDVVEPVLRNPLVTKADNPQDRLALARFFIQAEWYEKAFAELESIERDFKNLEQRVQTVRQDLMQIFGRQVLSELDKRTAAGQYRLAEATAQRLEPAQIGGAVQRDLQQFLARQNQARETLDRVQALLGDLAAKVTDDEQRERLPALRSTLLAALDQAGLNRLQPFLLAADDPQTPAEEKLALAYSGWLLGAEGATTDLAATIRLWDAQHILAEYDRAELPTDRQRLIAQLRELEGIGPAAVLRLLGEIPPVDDADVAVAESIRTVDVPVGANGEVVRYSVVLPPEYSPNHRYPCLVALRPIERSIERTAHWWCGSPEQHGWARRRGYVVVLPHFLAEGQREYHYSADSQQAVLASLRDARRRFAIDSDRVFLAGHHQAGDAAIEFGFTHPDEFAGIVSLGGVIEDYARFLRDNGKSTAWYLVRGELGRDSRSGMTPILDQMFVHGAKFDLIYCQYPGRGYDDFPDELPQIFEWMELHRRNPPPRDFEYSTLRQIDNRFHWVSCQGLPRDFALAPGVAKGGMRAMEIKARLSPGNSMHVNSPATRTQLRLLPSLVDFDRKLTITVNDSRKFSQFVEPDLETMLEDYRFHGDRKRIATALLEF